MKLRKKASGDVDEYTQAEAELRLRELPMLYEVVEDEQGADEATEEPGAYKTRNGGRHKRKDMRPSD